MTYNPQYVDIEEVPISSVPDDFTQSQKEEALEYAETKLQMDINEGNRITANKLVQPMKVAIKYLSTYQLVLGAEDVDSMAISDLEDDGSTKTDYANEYLRMYRELVDDINNSDKIKLKDDPNSRREYIYTTEEPDKDWKELEYDEPRFYNNKNL